ncbi:MAG: aspartate aminotransferase family protein [Bradymonadaceae bacterium]|nr:aspartate aminotransferase family protein [Lujinxingiaceae bacterium]
MGQMASNDADWRNGRTWSMVYFAGDEHYDFMKKAHNTFFSENGLNPMAFGSLKRMESEVVRMSANMLNGDANVVGTMTSGGTESILMAVKAARERAKSGLKIGPRSPEIVAPRTIHVAFEKAAHYFGLKIRYAPVDENYQVDVKALRKLINRNTVLVAASAPQYAQGMIDPIAEIGAITQEMGIPFHVDACFGGFFLPWMERLGYELPVFDFRVPGVTSMSADVHKYGYSAKGASVVLYRDMSYLKHQFFVATDSPLGIYASPSMTGTRPGGSIAAAWAAMMALGEDGYLALARQTMDAVEALRDGVDAIPELEVLGSRHGSVVCIGARNKAVDIYALADQLQARRWHVDRQQFPASLHCTVTGHHLQYVPEFLADLQEGVAYLKANPSAASEGQAPMYGMMAKIPFRGAVKLSVLKVMEAMHAPGGGMPDIGSMGKDDDSSPLFKAMDKYGDRAMEVLDKIDDTRQNVRQAFDRATEKLRSK